MRDVWSGNPDTDKFWASEEGSRISRSLTAQLATRAHFDRLGNFFSGASLARHNERVYRKLRLIK